MHDAEMVRAVRQEVARQLNVILSGQAGENTAEKETIDNLFPGSPSIKDRPVMHPFGFVSRATKGTISVVGRQGASPENRLVLGHRDPKRPTDLEEGEALLYASDGETVISRVSAKQDGAFLAIYDSSGEVLSQFSATEDGATVEGQTVALTAEEDATVSANGGAGEGGLDTTFGAGTLSHTNATGEFIAAVIGCLTEIGNATTLTQLGNQPLIMPNFPAKLQIATSFQE